MIISHKYKFIFIKTRKTAGTSIEVFLSQFCEGNDIVTPIWPHVAPHKSINSKGIWNPIIDVYNKNNAKSVIRRFFKGQKYYNHMPAEMVKRRIPEHVWKSYFKFCVERNPWEKSLSQYKMLKERSNGSLTTEQYFKGATNCSDFSMYTDSNKNLLVDRVLKYESLDEELAEVFNTLGILFTGSLGVRAKGNNKQKINFREVFNKKQIHTINKISSREISLFNYSEKEA